jgi:import receptor subunit TOM70
LPTPTSPSPVRPRASSSSTPNIPLAAPYCFQSLHAVMSGQSLPVPPPQPILLEPSAISDSATSSLWDRLSSWAADNKAVVYTIAGVTVAITAAGVIYYLNDSTQPPKESTTPTSGKSKSKKARRKAKKEAEDAPAPKKEPEEAKPGSCPAISCCNLH